ncbi:MAG: helix-turn-helix transcriptional regulator [Clostridiales bacterium]|nr:helix-turn-helix transcriptional regulator [Clostridiales bacterium]
MAKISKDTERISLKFKSRLIDLLDDEDLDLTDFCKKSGISQTPIRNALTFGIIPSVLILVKIADFFKVSFEYLICEKNENDFIESVSPCSFYERYDALRKEKNVKHSQIANVMPFSRNVISEWKRNNTIPTLDNLKELAKYFNVSIDYLLGRTDYK